MAAAGRARAGRSGGSGRRSLPAKEGGVENLRHREEGDAGRNLRHAPRWCSDEPRRAAAAAPRSDHGADGGSNTVRVDGISNTVRPLTPIDRRMGDVRTGSAADFSPSAWHPRQAGATGVDGAISHGEEPRPGGPRRLERHAAAGGARLPRRWSSPGKWRPRRRIRREELSLRPPILLQS